MSTTTVSGRRFTLPSLLIAAGRSTKVRILVAWPTTTDRPWEGCRLMKQQQLFEVIRGLDRQSGGSHAKGTT